LTAPIVALVLASSAQAGPPPVLLGTAEGFATLAGSTITNTGSSVISGDLGLHPGTALTGFPPATVNGAKHVTDAVAEQAKTDLVTAYNDAAGRPLSATSPPDIGDQTLTAGAYRTGSVPSLGLTGNLTLDAQGDPRAVFIFQVASTLVTATDSSVTLINGAQACNVYWQVGSSATLGTRTAFKGTVLALTSISVNDGVVVDGRLLARNGAVTLINDTIARSQCATGTGGDTGGGGGTSDTSGTTTTSTPDDSTSGAATTTTPAGSTSGATPTTTPAGTAGGHTDASGSAADNTRGGTDAGAGADSDNETARASTAGDTGGRSTAGDTGGRSTAGDAGGGESGGSSEQGSTALTGPNLPFTGLDIRIFGVGFVLLLLGVVLRRRLSR
jgi:hypothetical protein